MTFQCIAFNIIEAAIFQCTMYLIPNLLTTDFENSQCFLSLIRSNSAKYWSINSEVFHHEIGLSKNDCISNPLDFKT